jgi:hypothetical protein
MRRGAIIFEGFYLAPAFAFGVQGAFSGCMLDLPREEVCRIFAVQKEHLCNAPPEMER